MVFGALFSFAFAANVTGAISHDKYTNACCILVLYSEKIHTEAQLKLLRCKTVKETKNLTERSNATCLRSWQKFA